MHTESEMKTIRCALEQIERCETDAEAYALFHQFREKGIRFQLVGMILRQKLVEFGVPCFNSGYMDAEEYFGFKSWFDDWSERIERTQVLRDRERILVANL